MTPKGKITQVETGALHIRDPGWCPHAGHCLARRPLEKLLVIQGLEHSDTARNQGVTLAQSWCKAAPAGRHHWGGLSRGSGGGVASSEHSERQEGHGEAFRSPLVLLEHQPLSVRGVSTRASSAGRGPACFEHIWSCRERVALRKAGWEPGSL